MHPIGNYVNLVRALDVSIGDCSELDKSERSVIVYVIRLLCKRKSFVGIIHHPPSLHYEVTVHTGTYVHRI